MNLCGGSKTIRRYVNGDTMTKKKRDSLYSVWTVLIILCVLLVLFSLLFASFSKVGGTTVKAPAASATPVSSTDVGVQPLATTALLPETDDAGDSYVARITFLSDSTTLGLKTNGILADGPTTTKVLSTADGALSLSGISSVRIITGESTDTIVGAVTAANPDILVITIGQNGCAFMGETYFTTEYSSLVSAIKAACPNTVIICNSILPVTEAYATANSMDSDTIKTANNWIQQIAADNGCRYANSYEALTGANGYLDPRYDSGNGLVPNSDGLYAMLNYLKTHSV